MPPKADKIKEASLDVIKKWIEQGARENSGSKVMAVKPAAAPTAVVVKARPAGPPPMPGALALDPAVRGRRPGAVMALAASPWAPVVAVGGAKQVLLYHTDTAELLGVLPYPHGQVHGLKFSRNGKLLLAAGGRGGQQGKAVLYDIATGKVVIEVGNETDSLLAADLSADQTQIAVGGPSKVVRVYSTADGHVIREIKKHTDWVTAVEYSPDGILLATGDRNGGLFVWETPTGAEYFSLRGHTQGINDVSWRDDGNQLASASEDGTVRLWEMENGKSVRSLSHGGAGGVKFAHDGKLVSVGRDRVARLWDAAGQPVKQFDGLADIGLRTAISHDGTRVLAGDWSGTLKVWTAADAKPAATLDVNPAPVAERVAAAEKSLEAANAKVKAADDAAKAAKAAADKATAEIAAFQKAATDAASAAATAKTAVTGAMAEADKQAAALLNAQNAAAAKAVALQALTTAAATVKDASAKAPANGELRAQAEKFAGLVTTATQEADAAKKAVTAAEATAKTTRDKHAVAVKAVTDTATAADAAQKKVSAEQAARKVVLDAVAPATAALTAAQAQAATAKAALEKLKASVLKK
jgi:hypothetical protein